MSREDKEKDQKIGKCFFPFALPQPLFFVFFLLHDLCALNKRLL